jgi:hypothetical protein
MSRTPAKFKQSDLLKAYKAARAGGLDVERTEIGPGERIVLFHKVRPDQDGPDTALNAWLAKKHDAHST